MNSSTTSLPTQPRTSTGPLLPFGKYRGTPLEDVPDEYLLWLGTLHDLRNPLLTHVLHEMARRLTEKDRQPERVEEGRP